MGTTRSDRRYVVPLGEFRGENLREPDPVWKFIHDKRTEMGLSTTDISELVDCSTNSISKGERGGHVSITITRNILNLLGYDLEIVPSKRGARE